ncbi:flagellar filament capping protein FliD [Chitinasiproducens palmae]|uniref:Flagellar hook-associated protein 2 n=1 Tax=Chitinasiproducens palmae TaxID=1770053 RepID=A0A1H2PKQ6_9BURK|nr:flagellar filament capping protein FliD [Chitinasiproducens palmae]SDV46938.1 Flagellar capping protein FliD [Chitinasiproducens palmae]
MKQIALVDPAAYAKELAGKAFANVFGMVQGRADRVKTEKDGISSLDTALRDFRSEMRNVTSGGSVVSYKATVSDPNAAVATTSGSSVSGVFQFHVYQLAKPAHYNSAPLAEFDAAAGGKLRVEVGSTAAEIDLGKLGSQNGKATLATLAEAINADPDLKGKVIARTEVDENDQERLIVESKETGAKQQVKLSVDGGDAALKNAIDEGKPEPGQDLLYSVDGGAKLKSGSNTITHAGTTILFTRDTGSFTVTVKDDAAGTRAGLEKFVKAYNALHEVLTDLTKPGDVLGGKAGGPLQGQSDVNGLRRELARALNMVVGDAYLLRTGLELKKDGTLSLDRDKLEATLKVAPDALDRFFGKAEKGGDGVLARLGDIVAGWLDGDKSLIKQRTDAAERAEKAVEKEKAKFNERYEHMVSDLTTRFWKVRMLQERLNDALLRLDGVLDTPTK